LDAVIYAVPFEPEKAAKKFPLLTLIAPICDMAVQGPLGVKRPLHCGCSYVPEHSFYLMRLLHFPGPGCSWFNRLPDKKCRLRTIFANQTKRNPPKRSTTA
jgi:hypothetical protein